MDFSTVLPSLISLYRQGTLVPFIGSGMSRPTCTGWTEFLTRLAMETGIPLPPSLRKKERERSDSAALYRLADTVVHALRELPQQQRIEICRKSLLSGGGKLAIPPQTQSLGRLYWPLVVSTNYDDLMWSAAAAPNKPTVLGRSISDCHRVLRSLDEPLPPILWAVQGFVGGQIESPAVVVADEPRRERLAADLVIGHQQYQQAINAQHHFRRAFAEVYRRRSLLFLGSGILEEYLVNLFSEIVHHHGRGRHPHFALIAEADRHLFDPWFLQFRLGIVPVFYAGHSNLPRLLDQLGTMVNYRGDKLIPHDILSAASDTFGITLHRSQGQLVRVELKRSTLPVPYRADGECSVVSVGRRDNDPLIGSLARSHLGFAETMGVTVASDRWTPLDNAPSYAFRYGASPIFATAARSKKDSENLPDRRDLACIPEALNTTLGYVDSVGFTSVRIGPIASGPSRLWHPIHPFAQMLTGIRRFVAGHDLEHLTTIYVHIVDPSVWYPISAGKLPILELLSSDVSTRHLELTDQDGVTDHISMTFSGDRTLDEFLATANVRRQFWNIELLPSPEGQPSTEPAGDTIITSTMTVSLTPRVA
ncbi:MAG TPA: SIR2 family protein [Longimicrobium sp.]|nr:SIR2 family protein [Longimicrobium sp.]